MNISAENMHVSKIMLQQDTPSHGKLFGAVFWSNVKPKEEYGRKKRTMGQREKCGLTK